MKLIEELMNIMLQEYGALVLTVVSTVLSIVIVALYAELLRNNILLIKELGRVIQWINWVIK
ncbi:hypothetical protein [Vulcanisaeta souniana]|uniref:Uncharacterized protein n=1 Tax=Vulcanisaeta souniana JCM 11219 TaxID=1293586 RepID=A0A830EJM1_9CREN|nr:hypothetical protein [Vulcanisaeta souniana]BDR93043.1 hypothetical protein Vsou_21360 [Vulcanisaeta souniana JCM 11219]GGI83316.1 hypothetical protein GCM10007112_20190 [Vulcanisaeta souniana JCM 11219]